MKIINEKPLFFPLIKLFFKNFDWEENIFAFGKRVYTKKPMSMFVEAHEITHLQQQKNSYIVAFFWYLCYISSKKFRFNKELEAYQVQWKVYKMAENDRNKRAKYLDWLASKLSSPLYRNMISKDEAKNMIENADT